MASSPARETSFLTVAVIIGAPRSVDSDRGSEYAAKGYRERLELHGIRGSKSRRANPYDNAKAESFMKTLKHEEVNMGNYRDLGEVRTRLPRFIEDYTTTGAYTQRLDIYHLTNLSRSTPAKRSILSGPAVHRKGFIPRWVIFISTLTPLINTAREGVRSRRSG